MPGVDPRYTRVLDSIEIGYTKAFRDIFRLIPKSIVARDLGKNNKAFTHLIENVEDFSLDEIFRIADLVGCEKGKMVELVLAQYLQDRENKGQDKGG